MDVAKSFYSDLYKSKSVCSAEMDHVFNSVIPEKVLTEDLQEQCEGLISKDECFMAINSMKRNKSPVRWYKYGIL